ncbi:MAG TPA: aminopeptidase P N-terminal domain-containing protein [Terriglobales bacterium]|nr:aminopeptidase P N-terminal domain-containing protein [Terriglobales bacterium]
MAFSPQVYAERRRSLMERLGPRAAALFVSSPEQVRSNDVDYIFRQDNDLLYLTGFGEPGSACLLLPGAAEEFILFVRPRDPERETWTGKRAGVEGALERYHANAAFPIEELDTKVRELAAEREQLFYAVGANRELNDKVLGWLRQWQAQRPRSGSGPIALIDPRDLIHEMRLIKSAEELEAMRHAAAVGADGHLQALQATRPGLYEYEIEALIDYTFRRRGAAAPAYPTIVAGGANATILHYISNDQRLRDGDLLLIDAGADVDGYCSDITRTFPIGTNFTAPQRELYELVLQAQREAIAAVGPGASFEAPHQRVLEVLVEGLLQLGILRGAAAEIIEKQEYRRFFMHRTSHWLGMDVHDVGHYKSGDAPRLLEPGMVLTIEPGLYIPQDCEDVEPRYRGIGIRIEDDVAVTASGHEVLTAAVPKEVPELIELRAAARLAVPSGRESAVD